MPEHHLHASVPKRHREDVCQNAAGFGRCRAISATIPSSEAWRAPLPASSHQCFLPPWQACWHAHAIAHTHTHTHTHDIPCPSLQRTRAKEGACRPSQRQTAGERHGSCSVGVPMMYYLSLSLLPVASRRVASRRVLTPLCLCMPRWQARLLSSSTTCFRSVPLPSAPSLIATTHLLLLIGLSPSAPCTGAAAHDGGVEQFFKQA